MRLARLRSLDVLVGCCCVAMLAYFGFHAFHGGRGYGHRDQLAAQLEAVAKEAAVISEQRVAIEDRVKLMRPESIDPDLLDELARRELFLGKPNDIVVKTSQ